MADISSVQCFPLSQGCHVLAGGFRHGTLSNDFQIPGSLPLLFIKTLEGLAVWCVSW